MALAGLFSWVPQGGFPDPFPVGQCTYWAAYNVNWQGNKGNACQWWDDSLKTDSPKPGDLAVWDCGLSGSGGDGHVAVVTNAGPDSVTVSEMNWQGTNVVDSRAINPKSEPSFKGFMKGGQEGSNTGGSNSSGGGGWFQGLLSAMGIGDPQQFFQQAGFIVAGVLLGLIGLVIAFHKQIGEAAEIAAAAPK